MLFDEPHTGLDQDACDMLDGLLQNVAGRGRTVIITSHDLARVENLATRFDVLSRGVIAASSRRDDLGKNNLLDFYRQSLAS
jgi:ABC-type multidrug transport system ATPase subunit